MTPKARFSYKCPHCNKNLPDVAEQLCELISENQELQSTNKKLRGELDTLENALELSQEPRVASKYLGGHFHRSDCPYVDWIRPRNRIELSHEEAYKAGFQYRTKIAL